MLLALLASLLVAAGCGGTGDDAAGSAPPVGSGGDVDPPSTTAPITLGPGPTATAPGDGSQGTDGDGSPVTTEDGPAGSAGNGGSDGAPSGEPDNPAAGSIDCLSRRQRVAQLLLPLATQPELAGAQPFAAAGELGGIGLLGQPDAALADELGALQELAPLHVMVASDEEGGTVQRLATLLGPLPSAAATVAQGTTPAEVEQRWRDYGARLKALGIDVVFGPVLDVGGAPGIESRSFSDDPAVVATYARAVAQGLLDANVLPVLKHFPGHGRATADSHLELPSTPPIEELRAVDLVPYGELFADERFRTEAAVMVGHLAVPGLSGEVPTSLSPNTIGGLLRGELGFEGLVFTDAMNMGAIVNGYGVLEALELSFQAGADIAILGSLADLTPALDHLVARADADPAFAAVLDAHVQRVLAVKGELDVCGTA